MVKWLRALFYALILRCPRCERGSMFSGLFTIRPTCPHCQARFERREGESIGGTLINLCLAEMLTMGGYLTTQFAFKPPVEWQLLVWISFNLLFVVFFYRHARALWVAIVHLTSGLYADEEAGQRPS